MERKIFSNNTSVNGFSKKVYVKGKFLYSGKNKLYIKGVTYGTFLPKDDGTQYPDKAVIENDFYTMAQHGFNCIRTYTVPPIYLLNVAHKYGLFVMVGLPWEQHITFLDDPERKMDIIKRVKENVLSCAQHPAILCFTIGNEIPASIVRWYGKDKIENFLKTLYATVKKVDPFSLVTYVNFPTTEYLDLSFLDFDCFNVYLETPEKLSAYISRLHNLSGDRPLVLAEIGLDSLRNGTELQAQTLVWQIQTIFGKGCAGVFVFAWTDEWWRGGFAIEDWDFGLVNRQRTPKPALFAVSKTMAQVPFANNTQLPFISVLVCSYNGSATIKDTLEGLQNLNYPLYEVIVVNDGSTDNLAQIVEKYPVTLISTPNCGLSSARNTGLYAAKGEIVAYIDDDAYPDPHWLLYLAYAYANSNHAAIGGPNLVPIEDGPVAKCVANAPGGPVHVLLTDEIAEHIPGCNMSFKKKALLKIGGFDPIYRAAGDDVDVCWRIQESGQTIGFHPSALVWHHRRNSIKMYWKQQKGYGKAEALLEGKWPQKYNNLGHLAWGGRIYGNGFTMPIKIKKDKIFHGTWGLALFQSVYQPANGFINAIPLMPEWYLVCLFLAFTASLGFVWSPLLSVWPLFIASVIVVLIQAFISATYNVSIQSVNSKSIRSKSIIVYLHLIQPIARLCGRINHGLTPWRRRGYEFNSQFLFRFKKQVFTHWSEKWRSAESWLNDVESILKNQGVIVQKSGDFDKWDLKIKNGLFSINHVLMTIEEHGGGKQFLRFKASTIPSKLFIVLTTLFVSISVLSAVDNAIIVSALFAAFALMVVVEFGKGAISAITNLYKVINTLGIDKVPVETIEGQVEPVVGDDLPTDIIHLHPQQIKSKAKLENESRHITNSQTELVKI